MAGKTSSSAKEKERRNTFRFEPDPKAFALIDVEMEEGIFEPTVIGLILNESFTGCALALKHTETLNIGDACLVQVGRLRPVRAEVRWRTDVDSMLIKVGLLFVE